MKLELRWEDPVMTEVLVLMHGVRRVDAIPKVTGEFAYASDLFAAGMLYGHTVRSPHSAAQVKGISTAEAKGMPGVHAVLTHRDVPGEKRYGLEFPDQPLFLAVHFTLPHHPVFWADAPRTYQWESRPDVDDAVLMREQLYRAATREVDAQVGRFLAEAGRRGLLDDAIVVLLSDHGEAVGLPEDEGIRVLH